MSMDPQAPHKTPSPNPDEQGPDPLAQHMEGPRPSLLKEIWDFLRQEKKYWLTPVVLMLVVLGVLVMLSGTAVAPFIYTLF